MNGRKVGLRFRAPCLACSIGDVCAVHGFGNGAPRLVSRGYRHLLGYGILAE